MKFTKHVTFFYLESRKKFINTIIDEASRYPGKTDIFIHTNNGELTPQHFTTYTNGQVVIVYHNLAHMDPFYLSWLCRDLLKTQRDDYDVFMYVEDDIVVPAAALDYWINHNSLTEQGYNLGFVRIEVLEGKEYITDLCGERLDTLVRIDGADFVVNNKNPYCAFWIYSKTEFAKFVDSTYYSMHNIPNYGIRETSAIGLHGVGTPWYKATVIPLVHGNLVDACRIYHIANNYVIDGNNSFATIPFNSAVQITHSI